jgi:hypothetical protein
MPFEVEPPMGQPASAQRHLLLLGELLPVSMFHHHHPLAHTHLRQR